MKIIIFIFALLLLGCGKEQATPETTAPSLTENLSLPNAGPAAPVLIGNTTACIPRWFCLTSSEKAYQLGNCSLGQRVRCPLGCENDTCFQGSTCTSGFRCVDEERKGYQQEDCGWTSISRCAGGCAEGECLPEPNETTEEVAVEEETTAPPPPPSPVLKLGQTAAVEAAGGTHNLTLVLMNDREVRLKLDGELSDWIPEGEANTFSGQITVTVSAIYYQGYGGGKQEIEYKVE